MATTQAGIRAAQAYVRSIRNGEHSASFALEALLAADVQLETNGPMPGGTSEVITGRAEVLRRASGAQGLGADCRARAHPAIFHRRRAGAHGAGLTTPFKMARG